MITEIDASLLEKIADLTGKPVGAFNIRKDMGCEARQSTEHIAIDPRADGKPGIDIHFKEGTKGETCHIPVIISQTGMNDMVYNDFYVADDCDVTIVAGCGIHNSGCDESRHDGIHTFHIGKNCRVRYTEKHYGEDAKGRVISRSVAQDTSSQVFRPCVVGNAKCFGHVQCDSIIMGSAKISSVPEIAANDTEAQLIHEAAIGKIAGEQLLKLETLGLTEEEAEDCILKGFLA